MGIISKAINKLIEEAVKEIGYLEKKSNKDLDSKTGNAGSANFTKYWRDVAPSLQGSYWCACFISWIFMTAFGLEKAKKLLLHWPYITCQAAYEEFKAVGRCFTKPKAGDIVVFWNGHRMHHTGLVISVSGTTFTTIEGNTSGGNTVVPNGGGVAKKTYNIAGSVSAGHRFLRPDYRISAETKDCSKTVEIWQIFINNEYKDVLKKYGYKKLATDGDFGQKSKAAALLIWKYIVKQKGVKIIMNEKYGSNCKAAAKKYILKTGSNDDLVIIAKGVLAGAGVFSFTGISRNFGPKTLQAVIDYQELNGLDPDGEIGPKTWEKMLG